MSDRSGLPGAADESVLRVLTWNLERKNPQTGLGAAVAHLRSMNPDIMVLTETPIGEVTVLGVCIPWHMAEVTHRTGRQRKPWELHLEYIEVLAQVVARTEGPVVVAGDLNQRVPRARYGNRAAARALEAAFEPLVILTRGTVPGCDRQGIDHIAVSEELQAISVAGWPNKVKGHRMSDHDGAVVDLCQSEALSSL